MIPKQNRLSIVAKVIEPAKADSITGNFETQAQNLAMKPICSDPKKLDLFETT